MGLRPAELRGEPIVPPVEVAPFSICCGASDIPAQVMDMIWACMSVPDLLALLPVSSAACRDALRNLLTIGRLAELWEGGPCVHGVPYESVRCVCAFVSQRDCVALGGARTPAHLGERAARILTEGVRWILQSRLDLPDRHVLLRFFSPKHETDFCVCDVSMAARPLNVDCYVLRCRSGGTGDTFFHISMQKEAGALDTGQSSWNPGLAGQLLGSRPWLVGGVLEQYQRTDCGGAKRPTCEATSLLGSVSALPRSADNAGVGQTRHLKDSGVVAACVESWLQRHGLQNLQAISAGQIIDPIMKTQCVRGAVHLSRVLGGTEDFDLIEWFSRFPLAVFVALCSAVEIQTSAVSARSCTVVPGAPTGSC